MRVVVAEDSVLLREGLARLLTDAGHEVEAATGDAEEFLRDVAAHQPGERAHQSEVAACLRQSVAR